MKELFNFTELVSHTTRNKRPGELEGITYYYVNDKEFDDLNKIEEVKYSNNRYALSKKEVDNKLENNKKLFVIMDKEGIKQLKKIYGDIVRVLYIYSSPGECRRRLIARDGKEKADNRMTYAYENDEFFHYGFADYILRNKDNEFKRIIQQLKGIINHEY